MWRKIFNITIDVKLNRISASEGADRILSLMGEKELGVLSTSNTKDGVSHIVRDSHASELEVTEEVRSNGSLEKRTEAKEVCELDRDYRVCGLWGLDNFGCLNCKHNKLVDS